MSDDRAQVIIRTEADRRKVIKWAQGTGTGTIVEFRKATRSNMQNALLWARLSEIAARVEWYGQRLSAEDWKDMFSASLRKSRVMPGIDPGTVVALGLRTSKMTVAEMTALLDLIDAFAAERGIEFNESAGASSQAATDQAGRVASSSPALSATNSERIAR
jgi:hypothetical protein